MATIDEPKAEERLARVTEGLGREYFALSGGRGAFAARRPLGDRHRRRARAFLGRSVVDGVLHLANRPGLQVTTSVLRGSGLDS